MTKLEQEAEELHKRTLFLWRKAKNGRSYHLKQVVKVLDGLTIYRQYGHNQSFIYTSDSSTALLDAIAQKVIPNTWEWELFEDTMLGRVDLVITAYKGDKHFDNL